MIYYPSKLKQQVIEYLAGIPQGALSQEQDFIKLKLAEEYKKQFDEGLSDKIFVALNIQEHTDMMDIDAIITFLENNRASELLQSAYNQAARISKAKELRRELLFFGFNQQNNLDFTKSITPEQIQEMVDAEYNKIFFEETQGAISCDPLELRIKRSLT